MTRKLTTGIDLQQQRAQNAADASSATDLTTLQQVQSLIRGLTDWKDDVRGASTGNLAITALINGLVHDGVTYATGDSILLKNQTTASENGIYTIGASGTGVRRTDADTSSEVTRGMTVTVMEGTTKGTGTTTANPITYTLTTTGAITLGTTALAFSTVGGTASAPTSGSGGISVAGNAISWVPKSGGFLAQDAGGAYLDVTAAAAILVKKYASDIPAGGAGSAITMTHNFGTKDRLGEPSVELASTGEVVEADIVKGLNADTVTFGQAVTAGQYRYNTAA